MKYSITINQKQAVELGVTNISQLFMLDLLTGASTWASPEIIDGEVYYWVSRQLIRDQLPVLDLKSDTIYRHLKDLNDTGFIDYIKKGKKDCIKLTKKGRSYYFGNKSESTMSEINPDLDANSDSNPNYYVGNKSENNSDSNPTYKTINNIILKDDNNNNKTRARKFTPPTESEIEDFAYDQDLNLTGFFDYYESNGWMVGKNKMKNWRAAAKGWHNRQKQFSRGNSKPTRRPGEFSNSRTFEGEVL